MAASGLLFFIFFISCKKVPGTTTITQNPVPVDTTKKDSATHTPAELSVKVTASISGFIITGGQGVDEAIQGASVLFGNKTAITDEYGFFEIKDASVSKLAAQLSASKPGFITSYKTIITDDGASNFERMQLIYSGSGGSYSSSGLYYDGTYGSISIPPEELLIEGTNTPYSGTFHFYANIMIKDDGGLSLNMPGDLRGIDSAGHLKLLNTYGLSWYYAVGTNGEKLQLSSPATLKIKEFGPNIPASIAAWRYDETIGLWRQEGRAFFDGTAYQCTINKLGIWNFATSTDYTTVTAKIITSAGEPIPFTAIHVSNSADPNVVPVYRYAGADGSIKVAAPANSHVSFDVHALQYSTPVFSKAFDNAQADLSLGNVIVNTNDVFTINGSITSCGNTPVTNGFVMANALRFFPDLNGKFHFNTIIKNLGAYTSAGLIVAEEIPTQQKSNNIVWTLVPGNNDVGNISVCGTNEVVSVTCKLVDNSGNALPGLFVSITPQSYPLNVSHSSSDASGNVRAIAYENTDNLLTVYGSLNCGTPVFSTHFNTLNRDTALGNLIVSGLVTANVTGNVVDCNNGPIGSGYVIVQKDQKNYQYPINSNGTFGFSIPICNATDAEVVSVLAEDNATFQTGSPMNISLKAGNNNVGTLSACVNNSSSVEFMNFTIDTVHYSLLSPVDPFNESVDPATHWTQISGGGLSSSAPSVFFTLTGNVAVGQGSIDEFDITPDYGRYVTDQNGDPQPIVNITEYGPVSGYITGNITLKIVSLSDASVHDATCSFRVARKE